MNEKDKERFLFSLIDDRRIPASDVMGMLADCQVRKTQLNMIAEEVDKNWPGVCAIHAGEYKSRLYLIYKLIHSQKIYKENTGH